MRPRNKTGMNSVVRVAKTLLNVLISPGLPRPDFVSNTSPIRARSARHPANIIPSMYRYIHRRLRTLFFFVCSAAHDTAPETTASTKLNVKKNT